MAEELESCLDCGKPVSSTAKVCPHCGSTTSNSTAIGSAVMAILLFIVIMIDDSLLYETSICWVIIAVGFIVMIIASGMNQYEE